DLDLRRRIAEILERAERNQVHRVAGGTDFGVYLQTALQLLLVIGAERTREGPVLFARLLDWEGLFCSLGRRLRLFREDRGRKAAGNSERQKGGNELFHCSYPSSTAYA